MQSETRVVVKSAADIVTARQKGRALALSLGFMGSELTMIATAISEVARNIVTHARCGEVVLFPVQMGHRHGISVVARDDGPGIVDIDQAMQYGFSTQRGLGVGLPGAKMLMDDFEIQSKVGKGTVISMTKWLS